MSIEQLINSAPDSVIDTLSHVSKAAKDIGAITKETTNSSSGIFGNVIAAITGGLISGFFTVWYKRKEFRDAQKKLEVEIEKLKLSQREFENSQYEKFIDISQESLGEKDINRVDFLKKLNAIVRDIEKAFPPSRAVEDDQEAYEIIAMHIYNKSSQYEKRIDELTTEYPHVFPDSIEDLKKINVTIKNIAFEINDASGQEDVDMHDLLIHMTNDIMDIYHKLKAVSNKVIEEFNLPEKIRKEFYAKFKDGNTSL